MFIRYVIMILIFIFWKQIINLISGFQHWDSEFKNQIIRKRLQIILFVISFEAIVVHNLIGKLVFH